MNKRIFAAIIYGALFGCILTACGQKNNAPDMVDSAASALPSEAASGVSPIAAADDKPAYGGEASFSMGIPKTLNPLKNNDKTVAAALSLVFAPLVVLDDTQKPAANPIIAESVTFSDDRLTALIKINENSVWHDGAPITAKDIKYTIDVLRTANGTLYDGRAANIITCEQLNEKTAKITFAQPYSFAAYELDFPIIPRHVYEKKADDDPAHMAPIGCGPYKFSSYNITDGLELTVSDNAEPKPYITTVRFMIARDEQAGIDMFDSGATDALFTFLADAGKYRGNDKYNTVSYTTDYFDFLGFNCQSISAADRRALAAAVPIERITAQAYIGGVIPALSPINPFSWLYEPNTAAYTYDTEAAQAGYGGKRTLTLLINAENGERERAANMIKDSFDLAGVTVNITKLSFEDYSERISGLDYDMFIGGIVAPVEPLFDSMLSGDNVFRYSGAPMDLLLSNIFTASPDYNLVTAASDLQKFIVTELPFYGIGFRQSVFVTSSRIHGDIAPRQGDTLGGFCGWYVKE